MKKLLLSLTALAAVLGASAGTAKWVLGTNNFDADTIFHVTVGPGMTTTALRVSCTDEGNQFSNNVFYTTVDLTNPNLEVRGVMAKDGGFSTESVLSMGNRKNTLGTGQYIAGVNGDFFNMGGTPTITNGNCLVDGTLYTVSGDEWWNNISSSVVVNGAKDLVIHQGGVICTKTITFPSGASHKYWLNPGGRWDNYLCIYTPAKGETTGTNIWGSECTVKLISGSVEENNAVLEVTCEPTPMNAGAISGNMAIPADGMVLSGVGDAYDLVLGLKVGDRISLSGKVVIDDEIANPSQIIGGCSVLVQNGEVADSKFLSGSVIDHFTSNQARTAVGYNQDRTQFIMLVVDKFTASQKSDNNPYETSSGFTATRMAQLMKQLGCFTAMNYDGGGSSQLYNKGIGIQNAPYGDYNGYLRPVANGLFVVDTTPVDDAIAFIEVVQKNVNLAAGATFTPTVYGYNQYGVLVDKNVTDFTLTVAESLGTVAGTTFTAGEAAGSTIAVVAKGDIKCGVRILTNGGGEFATSGDDNAALQVVAPYTPDEPMGSDQPEAASYFFSEKWHFVNADYNDGWDDTDPNWDSADAIKAKSCVRYATGLDGNLYTVNMKTMSIAKYDAQGNLADAYKLPSLADETAVADIPDYYGCAISRDDAGNFIIGHYFTKEASFYVVSIYSPAQNKAKRFVLPIDGFTPKRIDIFGRAIGDVTKDGYLLIAPGFTGDVATQKVNKIHFTGDGDVDNVVATNKGLATNGLGSQTSSICLPMADKAENVNDDFYLYSKGAGFSQWSNVFYTSVDGKISENYAKTWPNYSNLSAFDTFTIEGKRFYVMAYAEDAANSNQQIVITDKDLKTIATYTNPDYTSNAGYMTLTAEKISDQTVMIYVYNCDSKNVAGAMLRFSSIEFDPVAPVEHEANDVTPDGLLFDEFDYEDGDTFPLTTTATDGAWGPTATFFINNSDGFDAHGQLTGIMYRGQAASINNQDYVNTNIQPGVVVRKVNEQIGKALVINQPWSPGATMYGWGATNSLGAQMQFSFFSNPKLFTEDTDKPHFVRVRLVFNIWMRGCHDALDMNSKGAHTALVNSIYATHERNWVIPEGDADLGANYPVYGIDFAKWADETGRVEDIPENPVVYEPKDDDIEYLDLPHCQDSGVGADPNGKPTYIINPERFMVYEFDINAPAPDNDTFSVQFNISQRNATFILKEVRFTDLGTDESEATLLKQRKLSWRYYNEQSGSSTGIEDITVDDNAPAEYFNLQGVRVVNPDNGIYIVRRGNKVTKELIR